LCAVWYAAHGGAIYNYFRLQLATPDEAEDLTAETFLRAVRHAERFDPAKASAGTWLLTIARNVLIDHIRSARVRRFVELDELRDLAADDPSPEERMLRREEVASVLDAMARLSAEDRELLGLRFGGELEIPEIAEALGVRPGTVRTRLWRALERLRERLA
jgi:RNA polymerase sigma-70 factor (ECF subfamily)